MEVLGHQHPTEQEKPEFPAQFPKHSNEKAAETRTLKQRRAAIGAGSDELEMARVVVPGAMEHEREEYTFDNLRRKTADLKGKVCASRRTLALQRDLEPACDWG